MLQSCLITHQIITWTDCIAFRYIIITDKPVLGAISKLSTDPLKGQRSFIGGGLNAPSPCFITSLDQTIGRSLQYWTIYHLAPSISPRPSRPIHLAPSISPRPVYVVVTENTNRNQSRIPYSLKMRKRFESLEDQKPENGRISLESRSRNKSQ